MFSYNTSMVVCVVSRFCVVGSAGVGVRMTEPLYIAPSLADLPLDVMFPQNLPSIVCVHVLSPQPGNTILDMCAAPGHHHSLLYILPSTYGYVSKLSTDFGLLFWLSRSGKALSSTDCSHCATETLTISSYVNNYFGVAIFNPNKITLIYDKR